MADGTKIEWTDATWNPVTGCSVVSPGCTNCYAMRLAGTRMRHHPSRQGLTVPSKAGPVWNGTVRFNENWLLDPLKWRRPRRIFVCAHGDLFHDNVPEEWIDQVFSVMSSARHHQFQVLTKRAQRMHDYVRSFRESSLGFLTRGGQEPTSYGGPITEGIMPNDRWPLPNVWLGVSVEDQARADDRIPLLLDTPAAVRWLSCEPLLGPVDLSAIRARGFDGTFDCLVEHSGALHFTAPYAKCSFWRDGGGN
jgi:protein gp37